MLLSYREMQRQVANKIANTSTDTADSDDILPKIKEWINTRYCRIYRSFYWNETIDDTTLTLTASKSEYAFDRDIEQLIGVFDQKNGDPIDLDDIENHLRTHQPPLEKSNNVITGDPKRLRLTGVHTVKAELSAASTVTIVSTDNTTDISPNCVRVVGKVNGVEQGENEVLTGTSTAATTLSFDANQKLYISVGTTTGVRSTVAGVITVTQTSDASVLANIAPGETSHKYNWFKVSPVPKATGTQPTWEIWYQKAFRPLKDDNDIPILDCSMEVVQGAFADALREDGLEQEANIAENLFVTMVKELQATRKPHHKLDQFKPIGQPLTRLVNDSYLWVP